MDVNNVNSAPVKAEYGQAKATATKATTRGAELSVSVAGQIEGERGSAAFTLDISASAKSHGEAVKGLTADQVQTLKDNINSSYQVMIKTITAQNVKMQGWLDSGQKDVGGIDFSMFRLPTVATTPEEAAKAVGEGGDYSVEKVADRIFGLASAIAGGDGGKLQEMQEAVKKGFKLAGLDWNKMTGQSAMPQITTDTYNELQRRFDEEYKRLGVAPAATEQTLEQ